MIDACMSLPLCPRRQSPMKVRVRRQEPRAGAEFLGCSRYPGCKFTLSLAGDSSDANGNMREAFTVLSADEYQAKLSQPEQRGKMSKATHRVIELLHRVHRRRLESDEPDATGKWEPKHRQGVLRYVYDGDDRRCGLCGMEMKLKGAQVEHIAPKVFTTFNINGGKAASGSEFKSVLHKLDNLQAAHSYCNKRKGNSPEVLAIIEIPHS